jgi:hypothetical protein
MGMFGKKQRPSEQEPLDGVITFYGSFYALRSESVLKKAGFPVRLIPGPRAISPNCGVALRFPYARKDEVEAALAESHVQFEAMHQFP